MADSFGIEALRRAILDEAEERARALIEQARESAREERERAVRAAEDGRARILREAEAQAEAVRRRIESTAELEGKRRLLEVREMLIRQVLDRALAELKDGIGAETRRAALLRLVVDAARETGGGRLVVQVANADMKLLTPSFLSEVRDSLAREGISAELEAANRPAEIVGGAVVSKPEGRVVVDNSFESRLSRQEPTLRSGIWRILSEREGG